MVVKHNFRRGNTKRKYHNVNDNEFELLYVQLKSLWPTSSHWLIILQYITWTLHSLLSLQYGGPKNVVILEHNLCMVKHWTPYWPEASIHRIHRSHLITHLCYTHTHTLYTQFRQKKMTPSLLLTVDYWLHLHFQSFFFLVDQNLYYVSPTVNDHHSWCGRSMHGLKLRWEDKDIWTQTEESMKYISHACLLKTAQARLSLWNNQ